ncbi:MAG: glycoside hydrolase family 5 protein [Microcoleus sp.]
MKGVNLGGWLVLERWIAPSVFHGYASKDEYSLCLEASLVEATARLNKHRSTFITEKHIEQIAKLGLNTVRVPVGYWLFGGVEPFVKGGDKYVEQLFFWADKWDIAVILDFHAAPGSQNGWDHSGKAGELGWYTDPTNIQASISFLEELCQRFGHQKALVGVEVLNEPHWDVPIDQLLAYYQRAYEVIRANCHLDVSVIFSDAFRPYEMAKALSRLEMRNIMIDVHLYQLFTDEDRALDLDGHLDKVADHWANELNDISSHVPVLVGEWSAAMSEDFQMNGQQSHRNYSLADYQQYFSAQTELFKRANVSWAYWTARTEDQGVWSFLDHPKFIQK